jgi:hypothetical protein
VLSATSGLLELQNLVAPFCRGALCAPVGALSC